MISKTSLAVTVLATALICTSIGMIVGIVYEEHRGKRQKFEAQSTQLSEILADPRFQKLTIVEFSGGGAGLLGEVKTKEMLHELKQRTALAFGKHEAERMVGVIVKP